MKGTEKEQLKLLLEKIKPEDRHKSVVKIELTSDIKKIVDELENEKARKDDLRCEIQGQRNMYYIDKKEKKLVINANLVNSILER